MAKLLGKYTSFPSGVNKRIENNEILTTRPSAELSPSIIFTLEPIFNGKKKNNITEAVILLTIDHVANNPTPTIVTNDAIYTDNPLKDISHISPIITINKVNRLTVTVFRI